MQYTVPLYPPPVSCNIQYPCYPPVQYDIQYPWYPPVQYNIQYPWYGVQGIETEKKLEEIQTNRIAVPVLEV